MKAAPETAFDVSDVLGLFSRHKALIFLGTAFSAALFMAAASVCPRKYKSRFTVAIHAKYFQNALVRDLVPDLMDPGEMKAQREALIWQALSPEFLDSLDATYGLYRPAKGKSRLPPAAAAALRRLKAHGERWGLLHVSEPAPFDPAAARQELMTRIQVFNLNNTTFQVSFVNADPSVTFLATRDMEERLVQTLLEARTRGLAGLRDAIRKRLQSMSFEMAPAPDPRVSMDPAVLREELADVRSQLRALESQYTDEHPMVVQLAEREQTLVRWLEAAEDGGGRAPRRDPGGAAGDRPGGVSETYNDLMKKLDYINIALDSDKGLQEDSFSLLEAPVYPKKPLWPKTELFALWGVGGGLFITVFLAALRDHFQRSALHADALAERLGIALLGELPACPWRKRLPSAGPPLPAAVRP